MNLRPIILGTVLAVASLFAVHAPAYGSDIDPFQIQEQTQVTDLDKFVNVVIEKVYTKLQIDPDKVTPAVVTVYANVLNQVLGANVLTKQIDGYIIASSEGKLHVMVLKGDQKAEQTLNFGNVKSDNLMFMETNPDL